MMNDVIAGSSLPFLLANGVMEIPFSLFGPSPELANFLSCFPGFTLSVVIVATCVSYFDDASFELPDIVGDSMGFEQVGSTC